MDLELSITLVDPQETTNTDLANESLSPEISCHDTYDLSSSDSGQFTGESGNSLLDTSLGSTCYPEEEEHDDEVSSPASHNEGGSNELESYEANEDDQRENENMASDPKVTLNNSNNSIMLSENDKQTVRHFLTSDGGSLRIQASTSTPKQKQRLSRNSSFNGPRVTNIRIGTPVKRSSSLDHDNEEMSEVEYTISISSQNKVNLQMRNPSTPGRRANVRAAHSLTGTPERKFLEHCRTGGEEQFGSPGREVRVGNQTVRLRAKKSNNRQSGLTTSISSQTDEMKRHSAEISQLRQALEQRIAAETVIGQNKSSRNSYHDSPGETRRPLSAFGYARQYESPSKENKRPFDSGHRHARTSLSQTSSPINWRNNRNTVHITDPKKIRFLVDGKKEFNAEHHAWNLYNEYKNAMGILGERINDQQPYSNNTCKERNSRNYNPYINTRSSTPFYDCEDAMTSQYTTPHSSPGPSVFRSSQKNDKDGDSSSMTATEGPVIEEDGRVNYYPNCDATIWLRSCEREITEPLSGKQIGKVPMWISGTLIRNGPGRLQVGEHKYNHLFDGSALLHRFHFSRGKVTYQNRFLKSRSYLRDTKAQRIVVNYFGTRAHPDPCRTILQNIASKFDFEEHFTDNAQISLYPYGDGLFALTETPFIFRVDPETLETHEKVDLTKYIAVLTHTAHPHVDRDGTVYNIGQGVGPFGPKYHVCKFPKAKEDKKGKTKTPFDQAQIVGSVNARWRFNPCYMHSFAMTDNYWIIIEQPLVVSVPKILKVVMKQDALIDALQWWEKETKIHVIRRDTGSTITTQYVTETFFFLHTINAYEDRGHIILDIATYKNAEMLHCMYVEALKNASYDPTYAQMFRGRPKRWVLPLKPNKDASVGTNLVTLPDTKCQGRWLKKNIIYLTPELLSDIGCEVPRIYYEKYNGRPYKYFYAICSDVDHPNPGTLVKVNVVNKTHVEWSEDNVYPSEPVFVPHPLGKNEDDGIVMSALLRAKGLNNQVCMLLLDAVTFKEKARVEFVSPGPVPKCLHGWFVPEGTLRVHSQEDDKKPSKDDE